ncbi:DUF3826 domain-containing protein [Spirosoma validum]|uniref:DUF3826 domain-containing protein n=1 Tax=Spirosoma validum TaxID=2771355 RepID=A0A927GFJ3_9BACT|nr:DUF3826 domain-containing protein [Spirosoma validum]MBD2755738.1 DUF3826 domain-containing protein [Spirosoma validum]
MNIPLKKLLLSSLIAFISMAQVLGQNQATESKEATYTRVVNERSAKIVATLGITDSKASARVQEAIAQQYRGLNTIHDSRKEALVNLTDAAQKETITKEADEKLTTLHKAYLTTLARDLNPQQIEQVKDGMTYGVLPITYKGYQAMLPDLTSEQKQQILTYLTEARERAMDEGSSEKKHAMFGKYKGRINNYLSAAGIDMKKASKEREERIAKEKEATKSGK